MALIWANFGLDLEQKKRAKRNYLDKEKDDRKVRDLYLKDQIFSKKIPLTHKRPAFRDKYGVRVSPYFDKTDVIIGK